MKLEIFKNDKKMIIKSANSLEEVIKYFRFAKKGLKLSPNHPRNSNYYEKQFAIASDLLLAAYIGDQLIGVILGGLETSQVLIGEFYIDPKHQRQGIGSQMLQKMEANILKHGIHRIYLGAKQEVEGFYIKNNYSSTLFVQFYGNDSKEKMKSLIEQYSNYSIIWKQDNPNDSKVVFQTKGLDKEIVSSIKKNYPEANTTYLFTKDL